MAHQTSCIVFTASFRSYFFSRRINVVLRKFSRENNHKEVERSVELKNNLCDMNMYAENFIFDPSIKIFIEYSPRNTLNLNQHHLEVYKQPIFLNKLFLISTLSKLKKKCTQCYASRKEDAQIETNNLYSPIQK